MNPLTMILALADDGTIGDAGGIPWRIPADMVRFKAETMGHAVIMGRKTWESLPAAVRPLPGRRNIVVSRVSRYDAPGASHWRSLETAIQWARFAAPTDPTGPFIIGGAELYLEALPLATRILLTEVHVSPGGDTRFELDRAGWREVSRDSYTGYDNHPQFSFVTLVRDPPVITRCA